MNLALLKKKVLQLMDEYTLSGNLQSDYLNADYLYRLNNLADAAQKEIAQVKKIHAVYSISQVPVEPQTGKKFEFHSYRTTHDITFVASGSQSFYFEVDRQATIHVEEETSANVWTNLFDITVPYGVSSFTATKGLITPSSTANNVRLRFTGSYPYNIRNVALFAEPFQTPEDVPDFAPYTRYPLPDEFLELERVVQEKRVNQYIDLGSYHWEGRQTLAVDYFFRGSIDVFYFRYPQTIDDNTTDDHELEVDIEAQEAMPYYIAAHIFLTDPTEQSKTTANFLINEYQSKLGNLRQFNYDGFQSIDNTYGW